MTYKVFGGTLSLTQSSTPPPVMPLSKTICIRFLLLPFSFSTFGANYSGGLGWVGLGVNNLMLWSRKLAKLCAHTKQLHFCVCLNKTVSHDEQLITRRE